MHIRFRIIGILFVYMLSNQLYSICVYALESVLFYMYICFRISCILYAYTL